jgi:hypothetical protein
MHQGEQRDPNVMGLAGLAFWPGFSLDIPTGGDFGGPRHAAAVRRSRRRRAAPDVAVVVAALVLGLAVITTYDVGLALAAEAVIGLVALAALLRRG